MLRLLRQQDFRLFKQVGQFLLALNRFKVIFTARQVLQQYRALGLTFQLRLFFRQFDRHRLFFRLIFIPRQSFQLVLLLFYFIG